MMRPRTLAVTKLAFYAEDPVKFSAARGGNYNELAAKQGTRAHNRIGRGPNKLAFVFVVSSIVAALIYFNIIQI